MRATDESVSPGEGPAQLDATDGEFWQDPHATLRLARERHPLAYLSAVQGRAVLRYDDVAALLTDPRLETAYGNLADGPVGRVLGNMLVAREGAAHRRLRGLLSRAFTPRHIEESRAAIRAAARGLLRSLPVGAVVDFQAVVADALTARVICEIIGIPREDLAIFSSWTTKLVVGAGINPDPVARDEAQVAAERLRAYLEAMVARRRQEPRRDLLDALIAAEEEGDRLSREELIDIVFSLLIGGHDTVRSFLGIATSIVLRHPDVMQRLQREPEFTVAVVEEVLRFESPLLGLPRIAKVPLEIGGVEIAAGSRVFLDVASANRDPRRFVDPDRFDPTRDASGHLSFGHGLHFCIGAALARVEAQELLAALATGDPRLALVDTPRWVPYSPARRLEALAVRVE